jgi:SSS family solute:Na+ symporter
MGGELYTTFTFLGIAGWVYSRGAEIYYPLAVGGAAYIVAYLYLPRLWRFAKERDLLTFADFFAARYESKGFGAITALLSTFTEALALLVYLTGLQIILGIAGLGEIDATHAVLIAFGLITLFVFTAGLRGMAWASVVKDALMIGAVAVVGFVLPIAFFGSPAAMLDHAIAARPHAFTIGAWMAGNGKLWFITTAILNAIGFFAGVNAVAATYAAKSEETVRRNAMLLPLYSLMIVPLFFAGYTASLVLPGLHGTQSDSAYLRVLQAHFPLWLLGLVCAAGTLAGLLPSATRLLAAASQLMKNVMDDVFGVAKEGAAQTWVTRVFIVLVASTALYLWVFLKASLVDLLLFVYNGQAQFMPGILLGLFWKRVTLVPIAAGLLVGEGAALVLTMHPLPLAGLNAGFVALALNSGIVVVLTFSLGVRLPKARRPDLDLRRA